VLVMMDVYLRKKYPDMSIEEEKSFYDEVLERVILNPRFYLDHLDNKGLWVFRVSFLDYKGKRRVKKGLETKPL
jgi:hypothetical protein